MNRSNEQPEASESSEEDLESVRKEFLGIARNASKKKRRRSKWITEWSADAPKDWRPNSVTNPLFSQPFTEEGAREFVVDLLETGHDSFSEVILDKPPGAKGYTFLVEIEPQKMLYIKIQLGAGCIVGRSFHYSYYEHGITREKT